MAKRFFNDFINHNTHVSQYLRPVSNLHPLSLSQPSVSLKTSCELLFEGFILSIQIPRNILRCLPIIIDYHKKNRLPKTGHSYQVTSQFVCDVITYRMS